MTRRPADTDQRGAVAVEAALLVPILMLLLFAVIEFALLMRDTLAVTEMSQVGARSATAMPRQSDMTSLTVDAMGHAGLAMPKGNVSEILIYRANANGLPGTQGPGETPSCAGTEVDCDRYTWSAASSSFVLSKAGDAWNPSAGAGRVLACSGVPGELDSVGIYVSVAHPWVTGFFGSTRQVADRVVLPFEPLPEGVCGWSPG